MASRWGMLFATLTAACMPSSRDSAGPIVSDSSGVRLVENESVDRSLGVEVRLIARLVPPDSSLTPTPWTVTADGLAGRVFIADRDRVAVFDGSGAWLMDFGRLGDGPGEFRSPSAIALDPNGAVNVWDPRRDVISRWSSEGSLLNEQRAPLRYWGPGMAVGSDWIAAVTVSEAEGGMVMDQRLLVRSAGDSALVHGVEQQLALMHLPCVSAAGFPAPKILAPSVTWTARADTIYYLNGPGYHIDAWVRGRIVESVRRAVLPIDVTDAMARRAVEEGPGPYRGFMRRCPVGPEEIATAVGHEELVSPVLSIASAPDGRLWISRTESGIGPEVTDVFETDGTYLGSFPFAGVVAAFLSDSVFVSVALDQAGTGEPFASIHRLTPTGSPVEEEGVRADGFPPVRSDVREFQDCPSCPVLVELPPGRFAMGSPPGEAPAALDPTRPEARERAERPQVEIEISHRLAIGKYEVTFAEWDLCVEAGGCAYSPPDEGWGRERRPVIHVARRDAEQYLAWLSEVAGEAYRLPSEAEWEFAARGGTSTARWWGDDLIPGAAVCDGCGSPFDNRSSAPVGSFPANPFGLHDMLGNVAEWVSDCWHPTLDGQPVDGAPRIETSLSWKDGTCERPASRGGAWRFYPWTVRAAARSFYFPGNWTDRDSPTLGFRVARTVES